MTGAEQLLVKTAADVDLARAMNLTPMVRDAIGADLRQDARKLVGAPLVLGALGTLGGGVVGSPVRGGLTGLGAGTGLGLGHVLGKHIGGHNLPITAVSEVVGAIGGGYLGYRVWKKLNEKRQAKAAVPAA